MWIVQEKWTSFGCMLLSQLLFLLVLQSDAFDFYLRLINSESQKNKPGSTKDHLFPFFNSPLSRSGAVSFTSPEGAE